VVRQHVRRIKVRSRVKDAYSVWRKMERKGLAEVEELTLTLTRTRTLTLTLTRTLTLTLTRTRTRRRSTTPSYDVHRSRCYG